MNKQQRTDFKECNRLIVYGTLRKGMINHSQYLGNCEFLGNVTIPGFELWTTEGSFIPYISPSKNESSIKGEAFRIHNFETFRDLDQLEGHPNFYRRILIMLNGKYHWIYIIHPEDVYGKIVTIENGDYVKWVNEKKMNSFVRR